MHAHCPTYKLVLIVLKRDNDNFKASIKTKNMLIPRAKSLSFINKYLILILGRHKTKYYKNNILLKKCHQVWNICFNLMFCQHRNTKYSYHVKELPTSSLLFLFYNTQIYNIPRLLTSSLFILLYLHSCFWLWTKSAALDNIFIVFFF